MSNGVSGVRSSGVQTTTSTSQEEVDTVGPGDTLSQIARQYGLSYQELARHNNIADPNRIYPGQEIRIPQTATSPRPTPSTPEVATTRDTFERVNAQEERARAEIIGQVRRGTEVQPDTPLPTPAQRIPVIRDTVERLHGDIPPELLLAIISREAGHTLNNEVNADELMQVTRASGHHRESGAYTNTPRGIENNIRDGIATLEGFNQGDIIRAVWHYNGGNNPYETYSRGQGDPHYLGHLADELERFVPQTFGQQYANPELVRELREAQAQVDAKSF